MGRQSPLTAPDSIVDRKKRYSRGSWLLQLPETQPVSRGSHGAIDSPDYVGRPDRQEEVGFGE